MVSSPATAAEICYATSRSCRWNKKSTQATGCRSNNFTTKREREQTKAINVYKIVWQAQGQVIDWVLNRNVGQLTTTTSGTVQSVWR